MLWLMNCWQRSPPWPTGLCSFALLGPVRNTSQSPLFPSPPLLPPSPPSLSPPFSSAAIPILQISKLSAMETSDASPREEEEEGGEQGSRRSGCGAEGTTSREARKPLLPLLTAQLGLFPGQRVSPAQGEGEDKRDGWGGGAERGMGRASQPCHSRNVWKPCALTVCNVPAHTHTHTHRKVVVDQRLALWMCLSFTPLPINTVLDIK